jgi:DNA processing protein
MVEPVSKGNQSFEFSSPHNVRHLLLALNAAPQIPRAAICRLGRDPALWCRPLSKSDVASLAAVLQVPRPHLEEAHRLLAKAEEVGSEQLRRAADLAATVVVIGEAEYPAALADLALPPPVLFVRGRLPAAPGIAIVGSRRADPYGIEVASLFARELAAAGLAILSGFAQGVDAAAHRGALAVQGGATVGVLGCGLGVDYPRGHLSLGDEIAASGALVSEFPCGSSPQSWNFPVRNRLIAALSEGTLVVQAAPRSGSLVTARLALELGREVYAVPGAIFNERSLGPNTLIRDGAHPVQHPNDIRDSLPENVQQRLRPVAAPFEDRDARPTGLAGRIHGLLNPGEPRPPEEIAEQARARVDAVLGALLELELLGLVSRQPGPAYCRRA